MEEVLEYATASMFVLSVRDVMLAIFFSLYHHSVPLRFYATLTIATNCMVIAGIFVLRHSAADPIAPAALVLSGHDAAVTCFHWSAPTNTVISGSADKTIRVYTLFKVS